MKRLVLHLLCLPTDLVAWLVVLVARLLWGSVLWRAGGGVIATELRPGSWPSRWRPGWRATTLGHAVVFARGYGSNGATWSHEEVHVRQYEAACVLGCALAALAALSGARWWVAVACLGTPWWAYLAASAAAWLRGGRVYRDNINEVSARAIAGEDDT